MCGLCFFLYFGLHSLHRSGPDLIGSEPFSQFETFRLLWIRRRRISTEILTQSFVIFMSVSFRNEIDFSPNDFKSVCVTDSG